MRMSRSLALAAFTLVCLTAAAEACPTCRQGLTDGQHAKMIQGYFWSIVFMMSMPFLIFTGLATYFYLQVSRVRRTTTGASPDRVGDVSGGGYGQRPTPA